MPDMTIKNSTTISTKSEREYRSVRQAHWDKLAMEWEGRNTAGGSYHRRLEEIYRFVVVPGLNVLEIGCGKGDLLAALEPGIGVGIDLSFQMVSRAAARHPQLHFIQADAHASCLDQEFDIIILSDLLNDVWDVQSVLQQVSRLANPRTLILINTYSRVWELPLRAAQALGLTLPLLNQNWLTLEDVRQLLYLADLEIIHHRPEILLPLPLPLVSSFANRFLVKLPLIQFVALTNLIVARPKPTEPPPEEPMVSVVVPARNEAGNVPEIFSRVPEMGSGTELIFVEGHSQDDTYEAIKAAIAEHPQRVCQLFRQEGEGKGDAVRTGFARASGDILMILDADLTVEPEALPRFYDAVRSGKGRFINGVRLVYPMEKQAMRFANLVGNKLFSMAFSWLLGQPIRDTLCGTKVLSKADYDLIAANRAYFGDFDPFGDFDLLFGAAKQNMKIVEIPVRYHERRYGTTNIQRWKHGWLLLKMVFFALRRIKFV